MYLHCYMRKLQKLLWLIKKIDAKETFELKKIHNHYLDRRKDIMKNTQFKVEEVFGDNISKDNFNQEKITKLKNLSAKILWILSLV